MKASGGVAYVTPEEMRAMDEEAIKHFGVEVLSMMEDAGAAVASVARSMLGGGVSGRSVVCLAGKGNNGGDGLVAARHLHNSGADVRVMLACRRGEMGEVASRQLVAVEKMGIDVSEGWRAGRFDLVVDALLGYSAKGPPREPVADLVRRANASGIPILAVDIPSGLDPSTGTPNEPCVVAGSTLTLGLPKVGFLNPVSKRWVGELYLADVSIPIEVYRKHLQPAPLFSAGAVVRLTPLP